MGGLLGSLLFRGWLHLRLVKSERPLQSLKDLALSSTVRNNLSFIYLSLFQLSLEYCKVSLLLLSNSSKCSLRELIYNQNLSYVSINFAIFLITAAWLVQLGERRYAEREVAGSNPGRTNT